MDEELTDITEDLALGGEGSEPICLEEPNESEE
jgi:hypothetical protein